MPKQELLIDTKKETKALIVPPAVQAEIPGLGEAFREADKDFLSDPETHLKKLSDSIFSFKGPGGSEVTASLLYDGRSKADEVLVIFAPFSDVEPRSGYSQMLRYAKLEKPGLMDKQRAKPNSWNQITKSDTVFELLAAMDQGLPVLTIFSPIPLRAYSRAERKQISGGDFSPASAIAEQAVAHAQDILHGLSSETRLSKTHLHGASLGANNAIAAASEISNKEDGLNVLTVTAQELIMGPHSLRELADGFVFRQQVGEPSPETAPLGSAFIPEPALRRAIDAHGNEIAMFPRMFNAMLKIPYLAGITHPELTQEKINKLEDDDVPVTIALADNSRLSKDTGDYLPPQTDVIKVKAMAGEKIGHIANESVGLTATVTALGVKKAGKVAASQGKIRNSEV